MGFFGSKTKYYVSSTVYNLMGDNEWVAFLKTTVIHAVLGGTPIGETITKSLLQGSGIRIRSFLRWANGDTGGYRDYMGVTSSTYYDVSAVSNQEAQDYLTSISSLEDNQSIQVEYAYMGEWNEFNYADIVVWNQFPQYIGTEYYVFTQPRRVSWNNYDVYLTIHTTDDENSTPFYEEKIYSYRIERETHGSGEDSYTTTRYIYTYDPINVTKQHVYILYYLVTRTETINPDGTTTTDVTRETKGFHYQQGGTESFFEDKFGTATPIDHTYAPYIPVRIDNAFLDKNSEGYRLSKKACKKAMGTNCYQDIVDAVADNEQLGDIDYTYMHFGVSLNTPYQIGRDYIFRIIRNLYEYYHNKSGSVNIYAEGNQSGCQFNIWFEWETMVHSFKQGLAQVDAKEGEYYFSYYNERVSTGEDSEGNETYTTYEHTVLRYQEATNRYEEFDITNFCYANLIYHGKSVVYSGADALSDDEDSGFIIPLQINTYKEMNLIDATDLTQMCNYLIFNCWEKKKVKWYQSGFFGFLITVVVVVVAVIITIINPPAGAAAAGGAAGTAGATNMATSIGIAMGLSGMAATVVGTLMLTAIGMIVGSVISALSSALFGDSIFGKIFSAVVTIILVAYGGAALAGQQMSISTAFGSLLSTQNILKLTLSSLDAYAQYMQASVQDVMKALGRDTEQYNNTMEEIQKLWKENLGSTGFSPTFFTDAMNSNPTEDLSTFISRTLMNGTDIARMSIDMLKQFASLSLTKAI